jgi:hypothetical protein
MLFAATESINRTAHTSYFFYTLYFHIGTKYFMFLIFLLQLQKSKHYEIY